jgi:tRNA (guanine37-N1)-methyltransferase
MNFHILTLFPDMVSIGLNTSIIGRAATQGLISIEAVNIRDYTENKHGKVDDYPYGGGAGMLMQAQPIHTAFQAVRERINKEPRTIYVTPQGRLFDQQLARELAEEEELVILCGHYEGVDERVLEEIVTDHISIGDYVLTGGELAAMVIIDAVARMVPGVLANVESGEFESLKDFILEYPQYSRPEVWQGKKVPEILLSGNHAQIAKWRQEMALERTRERRPDLYEKHLQSIKCCDKMQ